MTEISPESLRLPIFLGLLLSLMLFEAIFPKKQRALTRQSRWPTNILISVINTIFIKIMGPVVAVIAAGHAAQKGYGLFNFIELNIWLEIIIAIILLDMAIYFQHVISHKIPILWRLHRVHHSDRDIDVTTAIRFHPIEIIFSMLFKCALVFILGPAVLAVIIFEITLNGCAMFNHANLRLPSWADHILRIFIVTPDMHRVHHSIIPDETNSNYGFSLSIWDKVFGTYTAQPSEGHDAMTIGLKDYQTDQPTRLEWSLILPFKP